jgi:hypothetical protein
MLHLKSIKQTCKWHHLQVSLINYSLNNLKESQNSKHIPEYLI